ncbi:MAG: cytochrome d ubiquinol oxidase subunit II [Bryobacterales bacterium]
MLQYHLEEGLMTRNALSENVSGAEVLTSIILFGVIYGLLFWVWLFVLHQKISAGPQPVHPPDKTTAKGLKPPRRRVAARRDGAGGLKAMDLQTIWFILLGVLLGGYAALDGFDFGVGILHPLARTDAERRTFMNAIGPIWDGNEVWLITFGGALFAAFPMAYATAFSAMYLALMLVLAALIFRAVAIEFRSKRPSPVWRATWDWAFFGSSLMASLLFGVAAVQRRAGHAAR